MFIIATMPRCRSKWLSMLMTSKYSFCRHEPLSACYYRSDLPIVLESPPYKHTGGCGSDLAIIPPDWFLQAMHVTVHRPAISVYRSLMDLGLEADIQKLAELNDMLLARPGLHVDFDDLDMRASEIYEYCTGLQIDEAHLDKCLDTHISGHLPDADTVSRMGIWFA